MEKNKNPAENFSGYVGEARELLRRHYTGYTFIREGSIPCPLSTGYPKGLVLFSNAICISRLCRIACLPGSWDDV